MICWLLCDPQCWWKRRTVFKYTMNDLLEHGQQPSCWKGGWLRQQWLYLQVWRKDLYFGWRPHTHLDESSKHPWCGNMTSHYGQTKLTWKIQVVQKTRCLKKKKSRGNWTHWLLWGKSSRCCIVTKGWMRASAGAILSSVSINNIFFSRLTNSRRSAFSANKSLPSRFIIKFTWNTNTG